MNSERVLARYIVRNVLSRRNYGHGRRHPIATMNDLPTPQGDFFARHAANQRRYNTILGVGLVSFTTSVYLWLNSGSMPLNWSPPSSYE